MVVKLASLKADLAREAKGDWIDYPDLPGVAFKVSSTLSEPFVTERDLFLKKMAARNKPVGPNDPEMVRGIGQLYCQHILHDWKGFDAAYSEEVALEALTDVAHRDLRNAVDWCARKIAEVNVEFVDAAVKNSEAPSAGG
ncbi:MULTISPECIES: hypothetical protein [unclassified Rhizobium]|uniref:hypothetical protein n=1 Tax=unclassified Rhizobium TaxID=2613769 RepID=UPI00161495C7|nr:MULTISPECIES: hypothetical protein [unclassified Rhizobium]MBB3288158.1 hypothetical protein [Rhizobium sp. BK252]MBB3402978.1 hypothetical protein [Rhizobium sp. BK289]MBB3415555.1 hypothetical protein [Rhizobium sp. BK284]MBB3483364.1 hypothetical protein [Rhizobium sp. BK347]